MHGSLEVSAITAVSTMRLALTNSALVMPALDLIEAENVVRKSKTYIIFVTM